MIAWEGSYCIRNWLASNFEVKVVSDCIEESGGLGNCCALELVFSKGYSKLIQICCLRVEFLISLFEEFSLPHSIILTLKGWFIKHVTIGLLSNLRIYNWTLEGSSPSSTIPTDKSIPIIIVDRRGALVISLSLFRGHAHIFVSFTILIKIVSHVTLTKKQIDN